MRTSAALALALVTFAAPAAWASPEAGRAPTPPGRPVTVLLELGTEAVAPAWQRAATDARRQRRSPDAVRAAAAAAGAEQRARAAQAVDRLADGVRRAVPGAKVVYRTRTLLSGVAVTVPAGALPALAALPGVRAVHPVTLKRRANAHSVPLTGAPDVWSGPSGNTGAGVRIGIVDSGIDYTHADFGGPGTPEAFAAVDGAEPAPAALFPNAKVIGGRDLVGDDYNPDPSSPHHQPVPHPDANPIDCAANGHGTHVAGTAAGLGVTKDGKPYRGPYRAGLDPAAFAVGPGAAPGAALYALRVFGCDGSTDQLAQAFDLAADPNGDGDLSDRLDVVNLSLGSAFGSPDDADSLAADRLSALGTVVVASAGNEGDLYGIGGSPGTAARVLTVAASVDAHGDGDGIRVLAPESAAGVVPGHWSAEYTGWSTRDVTADLARPADQEDGCTAFSAADAARLKGRIAVLGWRSKDADRACGSALRADHAADAGAVGTLFAADGESLAEIAGDDRIPAVLLARSDAERLTAAMADGPVRVQLAAPGNTLHGAVSQDRPERTDTLTPFTSRGIGEPGIVKPDLAAPGETIWSAKAGSGSGGMREDGTSMAAPHASGLAALVRAAHPDWPVAEIKAALMNTAVDTRLAADPASPVHGPERTGAGRARVDGAVTTPAVAYAAGEGAVDGAVGLSFGPVEVTGPLALERQVEIRNHGDAPLTYTTGYAAATELPGASFGLSPAQVTVDPGGTARVTVILRVPGSLDRAPDPTLDLVQAGRARSYRGELSGRLLLTPVGAEVPQLRVPLFAAPRAASQYTAGPQLAAGRAGATMLALAGSAASTTDGVGLLSAFVFGGDAARWPDCADGGDADDICVERPGERAANLRYAGAASDAPAHGDPLAEGTLYLAAALWGPAASPVGMFGVRASLDTDGDGRTDAIVAADRLRGSDVLVARTRDARTGKELDVQPLNARWGDTDTGLLDGDALVLPVRLSALPGLRPGASTVHYALWTGQALPGAPSEQDALGAIGLTGGRPALALDVLHPALDVRDGTDGPAALVVPEHPGSVLRVARADGAARLLLLHHLNPDGRRAEVVTLR
ncbi:PA domain-containing protein [Streptomyces sp. TLI_235]|nr:S8 family serine peptidase [Streptomyces sp. TLI_235]PBC77675.1 PA domain-containing protein [Streptomyces sp. TLI_235]